MIHNGNKTVDPKDISNESSIEIKIVEFGGGCGLAVKLNGKPKGDAAVVYHALLTKEITKTIQNVYSKMKSNPEKCVKEVERLIKDLSLGE